MKKSYFMHKMLTALTLVAFAAMTLVSCSEKEPNDNPNTPDTPDTPEQTAAQYFVLGQDSTKIDLAHMASLGDMIGTGDVNMVSLYLANGNMFECIYMSAAQDSVTFNFADMMTFLFSGQGCYGAVMNVMSGEEDNAHDMASGTITLVNLGNGNYRIRINGTTDNDMDVDALYEGTVVSQDNPSGTGSLSINSTTAALSLGIMSYSDGQYAYVLNDATGETSVMLSSTARLNGTMAISNNEADLTSGNAVAMAVSYVDPVEGESVDYEITNGTLTCNRNGQEYSLTFSGTTEAGAVSGSYTGKIIEVFTDYIAK